MWRRAKACWSWVREIKTHFSCLLPNKDVEYWNENTRNIHRVFSSVSHKNQALWGFLRRKINVIRNNEKENKSFSLPPKVISFNLFKSYKHNKWNKIAMILEKGKNMKKEEIKVNVKCELAICGRIMYDNSSKSVSGVRHQQQSLKKNNVNPWILQKMNKMFLP